jgi:hypothetical protein
MGKQLAAIDDDLAEFLQVQSVFFVGTAPLAADGHLNLSPKGLSGSFRVLGPTTVAYRDVTGSGAESLAHIRENGRIVLMFCAFEGPPRIVRLHGRAEIVVPGDARWDHLVDTFPHHDGTRTVVVVQVGRVSTSCGFGVPLLGPATDRDLLDQWAARRSPDQLAEYHRTRNAVSIDGLPALPSQFVPGD